MGETKWFRRPQVAFLNPCLSWIFFAIYMVQWVKQNDSKSTSLGSEVQYRHLSHFKPENLLKTSLLTKNSWSDFFRDNLLRKFNESTGSRFQSQHKLYGFLEILQPNNKPKYIFFQIWKSTPSYEYFEPYDRRRFWPHLACFYFYTLSTTIHWKE